MTSREVTMLVWGLIGLVVVALELVAILTKGRIPGIRLLVDRLATGRLGTGLFALGWMWLGWHAFAR
jgi:hypothetical protein